MTRRMIINVHAPGKAFILMCSDSANLSNVVSVLTSRKLTQLSKISVMAFLRPTWLKEYRRDRK